VNITTKSSLIFFISIATASLTSLGLVAPGVSANPDVFANPEEVRYEGNGGLILPPSVNNGTRNEVIRCRGCGWKLTAACVPGPDNYCDAGIRGCPGLIDHMRVWFQPPGGDWKEVDRICLTNYAVTTITDLENGIADNFARYVPEQVARCWPTRGAVTNLPLVLPVRAVSVGGKLEYFYRGLQRFNYNATVVGVGFRWINFVHT